MDRNKINRWTIALVIILLVFSAMGYLFAPEKMLSIVGITGNQDTIFLVRTLAAAMLSFVPAAVIATTDNENLNVKWYIVFSLAMYMILSALVDLYGYISGIVNFSSVPSIVFRILIGTILILTNGQRKK